MNTAYKVEGIGYDFIPEVLDQQVVDKWYKTNDRDSFHYSRRLIAEEGLLVGGSSGSAMAAAVEAARELKLGRDDVIVVVLPDSIRSYLSKFVDDDWLAANDLLPPTPPAEPSSPQDEKKEPKQQDQFHGATVRSLRLKPVQTVTASDTCASAIETMRDKGFDQLPVLASTGRRLVGLVTLGNLLSRISHDRATAKSPISDVMFDFTKISEVVTDPRDLGDLVSQQAEFSSKTSDKTNGQTKERDSRKKDKGRKFVEITIDTPLVALNRFFEWQSAAIVTERDSGESGTSGRGGMKPVAVVTKVDLLTWMLRQDK